MLLNSMDTEYDKNVAKVILSAGRSRAQIDELGINADNIVSPRPCSHGYDIVPFHFGLFQKVVQREVAFTRERKKSSGPFQNRSRNWAVRKSEPEIGTIRYRIVPFSCEQKRYDIVPLFGPVWYLRVTPSWFL